MTTGVPGHSYFLPVRTYSPRYNAFDYNRYACVHRLYNTRAYWCIIIILYCVLGERCDIIRKRGATAGRGGGLQYKTTVS